MTRLMYLALPLLLAGSAAETKSNLKWGAAPSALPAGAQMAVVSGDPGKAGPFTIQLKFPPRYVVRPHWHPADEKVTLLSGKLVYDMARTIDRSKAKALAKGKTVVMKAKTNHWVFTGDGATVQVSSTGPFQITYVNPKDDPRKAPEKRP